MPFKDAHSGAHNTQDQYQRPKGLPQRDTRSRERVEQHFQTKLTLQHFQYRTVPERYDSDSYVILEVGLIGALLLEKATGQAPWSSSIQPKNTGDLHNEDLSKEGQAAFGTALWRGGVRLIEEVGYKIDAAQEWCHYCYSNLEDILQIFLKNIPETPNAAHRRLHLVTIWAYVTSGIDIDAPNRVQMLRDVRRLVEDFVADEELSDLCKRDWDRWEADSEQVVVDLRTQGYISCVAAADSTLNLQESFFLPLGEEAGTAYASTPRRKSRLDRALQERWEEMETSATSTKTLEEIFLWNHFQTSLLWFLARIAIRLNNAHPSELVKTYKKAPYRDKALTFDTGKTNKASKPKPVEVVDVVDDEDDSPPMPPHVFKKLREQMVVGTPQPNNRTTPKPASESAPKPTPKVAPEPAQKPAQKAAQKPASPKTPPRASNPDPPRSVFSPTAANLAGNPEDVADEEEAEPAPSTSATPSPIRRKKFTPLRAARKKPIITKSNKQPTRPGGSKFKQQFLLTDDDDLPEEAEEDLPKNNDDFRDDTFGKKHKRKRPHNGKRRPWSEEELQALEKGIRQFGNSWAQIEAHFGSRMPGRSQIDLKDKARTEMRKRRKLGLDEGVWGRSGSAVPE
ncbi:hypothetical protein HK097_008490 [Rhizophlyctis rosea]|uniref:Myb-like domain-containing protein n=1 Tax=Rhizophlyctis rosea TaxID=64517 RepID=A0AAD5SLA2_9FUNG|nr:hypothetical protein HK097_008490 [Rhizophlyctis rosea]